MANTVMPKPPGQRQRRNRAATGASLEAQPAVKAPLPPGDWHPMTVAWWDTIWDSPMAAEWVAADLPALYRLAALDDMFWGEPRAQERVRLGSEIRQQQMQFGLTPMSRRQLQWEVRRVEAATRAAPPQPTRAQRRGRMAILEGGRASA